MFKNHDAVSLGSAVVEHLDTIPDEVIFGCTQQFGTQGYNVARQIAMKAGLPDTVPATTINKLCGSSMEAVHIAYAKAKAGLGSNYLVGGVETMTTHDMMKHYKEPKGMRRIARGSVAMGLTAEMVAKLNTVPRRKQDEYAWKSHQRASAWMHRDINVLVTGQVGNHAPFLADHDEGIRADSSVNDLGRLRGAFDPRGSVTAGNSSGIADGASGLTLVTDKRKGRFAIRGIGSAAGTPATMGLMTAKAIQNALNDANLSRHAVDIWEINEAFAATTIPVLERFSYELPDHKVNLWGGSIAIGHPLGSSGTRILHTLMNILRVTDKRIGCAAMCIGMGQGIATVIERIDD